MMPARAAGDADEAALEPPLEDDSGLRRAGRPDDVDDDF